MGGNFGIKLDHKFYVAYLVLSYDSKKFTVSCPRRFRSLLVSYLNNKMFISPKIYDLQGDIAL